MEKAKSLDRRSALVYEEGSLEFEQDSKGSYVPVKMLDTEIQRKEDDEETAFDRDFIKVEKETIDIKDSSQVQGAVSVEEQQSISKVPLSDSLPKIEMEEAQETIKELEIRLEAVFKDLHGSESERAQLLSQVASANEKLCKREEHSQQLELVLKNLKDESGSKHNLQLQSIQKAQKDHEALQSELLDVKKAFDESLLDLVASRKKTEELELDLSTAVNKAKKYEELSREKDSHAEIQSKKASEYEKLVEAATLRSKEMEDKIAALQEELKALHSKTAEDQQIKEEHSSATSDLLKVQEELVISKLQVDRLEQRVTSDGATIEKLTQDLNHCKASEEHAKNEMIALENLLSASNEELQVKTMSLQEVESKYEREVKINEGIESTLRNQHKQVKNLQEKLVKVTGEKEALEAVTAELNASLTKAKETCELLENKLSESDQKFSKADSLLTQTMSYNFEIEQKLKALEELHRESGMAAETATQRKLELEDLIRSSNAAEEELKALLRETELKLVSAEQRNLELEQQQNLMELKCNNRDQELNELKVKTSELTTLLKSSEEESALSSCHFQASEERVNQLELSLNNSSKRILELEQELKDLADKCTEHESQAGVAHQRSIELEDLIQKSHSKSNDAESKVAELEIVLEATKYRVQELEEQLSIGSVKYRDAEEELAQYQAKVSELKAVAEAFQLRSDSHEIALQAATDKEKELRSQLKSITEEKNKFEQSSHNSSQLLLERENLLKVLQFELNSAKEKLEGVEKLLGAKDVREQELLEKLRSTEEKLEHQGREVDIAAARSLDLESLHETLAKDSELKLQETLVSLSQKDSEAKQLSMKLQTFEEEATFYQTQAAEATEKATFYQNQADEATKKATSLKAELEASSVVQLSLEETIAELKIKIKGAEIKVEQASSEYEMIANTNTKLKEELVEYEANVNKLQELVNSITAERDTTAEQLASHAKIISELTDKHARGLDLHLESESRVKETEEKLLEAIEQLKIRDSETKILNEKLLSLESKVTMYEKQASEAAHVAENRKVELDVALLKSKKIEETAEEFQRKASQFEIENESLATTNLKLTHDLASYETKLNELQTALDAVLSDKEGALGQLNSSRKTVEDLGQQLAAEGERLQSQISSVMEENYLLSEMHQNTKKDLQGIICKLEGQLNEQKAKENFLNGHIEDLKADLMVKSEMQARVSELEQHLVLVDNQFKEEFDCLKLAATEKELLLQSKLEETLCKLKERDDLAAQLAQLQTELHHAHNTLEQKEADSKMELERQASIKQTLGELDSKHQHILVLEKKIEELEQKLQIADLQYKEKVETSMKQSLLQVETEHQHVLLLQDKVEELEKELQIAETKCQEKDREEGRKLALANVELDGLKNKLNETAKLEEKIKELDNELQLTSAKQNEGALEAEGRHDVEIKSRDISLGMTKPLRRKSKKRSEGSHQPAGTSATTIEEHSLGMTLKFILGIALVSMVIGIILGKRY